MGTDFLVFIPKLELVKSTRLHFVSYAQMYQAWIMSVMLERYLFLNIN